MIKQIGSTLIGYKQTKAKSHQAKSVDQIVLLFKVWKLLDPIALLSVEIIRPN